MGRPKKEIDHRELTRLREDGLNLTEIAQTLGVSRTTLYRNGNGHG